MKFMQVPNMEIFLGPLIEILPGPQHPNVKETGFELEPVP